MTAAQRLPWLAGSLLAIFIAALYTLTFNGRPISTDEMRIMDGVTSFYHYGDWQLDETMFLTLPQVLTSNTPSPTLALPADEASLSLLVLPLYALAHALPGLGMLHTVWLFNLIVTTATVGLFYITAWRLGYRWQVAWIGGLLLGSATLLWPYSKTLFREPMTTFLLLSCVFGLLNGRLAAQRRWRLAGILVALIAFGLALVIKISVVLALPALVVLAWPFSRYRRVLARLLALILLVAGLGIVLYVWLLPLQALVLQLVQTVLPQRAEMLYYLPQALQGYLFSLNGSLGGSAPVLLLAVVGGGCMWRAGQRRLVLAVVVLILSYSVGHGLLTIQHWFGGLSYPPRFLLPVTPLVMLLVLPLLELIRRRRSLWLGGATFVLVAFSIWIQWINVASFVELYASLLPPESRQLLEWQPGLNSLTLARWQLLPQTWGALGWDVAWWRAPDTLWLVLLLLTGLSALALSSWLLVRGRGGRWSVVVVGVLALAVLGLNGAQLLRLNHTDGRTASNLPALDTVWETLEAQAQPGDVLLLPFSSYTLHVFNHNRSARVRPFTLPIPRLANLAADQSVFDYDSDSAMSLMLPRVLAQLALRQDHVWLLTNTNQFQANAPRADERYLARHLYWIQEIATGDPTVRLLEYSLTFPPLTATGLNPDILTPIQFGDVMRLSGVSLPQGISFGAGDILPVQLHWQADRQPEEDYTVTMFLAAADGRVVAQGGDGFPAGGFAPTTRWQPGIVTLDRRALQLPPDLAAGDYQLWVVVYHFVDGQPERLLVVSGEARDATIAVLPVTIAIYER